MSQMYMKAAAATLLLAVGLGAAWADERIEGKVTGTRLTACQFKPGGCEGTLTMETNVGGKIQEVTIKVPLGTMIKLGNEVVYLPATRGKIVAVTHVTERTEKIARTIEVKP
ncbi:MAG: hypothetical protein A3F74_16550 [Betaproteobacteria bacterium RIFCSPLOWO2_12_FULL_62_58]|nr:MAG: hypothetical protein A3F74_16550 [Betaproteobacteria bacterium RIFCSPLOWO2_12_FULL_62_58]